MAHQQRYMIKSIVIARHAKSDWSTGLPDHDRPLNARGKEDAPRMARALEDIGFKPDIFLSSTALRARSTAEIVARHLGYHGGVRTDPNVYEGGHDHIASILQKLPDNVNNAILFGHNPILEEVVTHFLQMRGAIVIPTSGMVCLEANIQHWSTLQPGQCQLKWFLIPKLLS
jgi:phosphohistidine phosphatase